MARINNNNPEVQDNRRVDADQKLFVPMHLEALVIGKRDDNSPIKWKSISPDYKKFDENAPLGEYLVAPICNAPSASKLHDPGIQLHWVLPQAYRHGTQQKNDGSPDFPFAPNRWLITRIAEINGETEIKRWIVESDAVDYRSGKPNWLMLEKNDASKDLTTSDNFVTARIGNVLEYDDWVKKGNKSTTGKLFLTIMSPTDPAFAASYHSCKNVFGFYDAKAITDATVTYTYSVTGWISNPKYDILAGITDSAEWDSKISALSWNVEGADKLTTLPGGVICHATINNVEWIKDKETESGKPKNDIRIGIGNTVPDAFAPLLVESSFAGFRETVNPFLSALQYNVMANHSIDNGREILKQLKAAGGPGANTRVLKKQAHDRGFQSISGGSTWVLSRKRKRTDGFLGSEDETEHNIPLQPAASNILKELNGLQYQFDNALNIVHSLQGERYGNWYKETKLKADTSGKLLSASTKKTLLSAIQEDNQRIDHLLGSLGAGNDDETSTEKVKEHYNTAIDDRKNKLLAELKNDPNYEDNYELTESKMPPFYAPNEPCLVITGLQPSKIYSERPEQITCRTEEQLINYIAYEQGKSDLPVVVIKYQDIFNDIVRTKPLSTEYLPVQVTLLLIETLALCPLMASTAANYAWKGKGSQEQVRILTKELADLLKDPAKKPERFKNDVATAIFPESYSVKFRTTQPWIPLFMEWEIEWSPGYTQLQNGQVLEKWNFGDDSGKLKLNNIDYSVKADSFPRAAKTSYKGRVALSADLGNKLKDLITTLGKDNVVTGVEPMYQSLSSLNQQLTLLQSGIQLPPVNRNKGKYNVDGLVTTIEEQYLWHPSENNKGFYPLRSGMFRIKNLFIIDAFGQNMTVINSFTTKPDYKVNLHVSSNMETVDQTNVALPPRLSSPARLRFKWLNANDSKRETDTDPGTSPICGWLVHNKLDKSLMVFDAAGKACGSLKLNSKKSLVWMPPPGIDSVVNFPSGMENTKLDNFVKNIYASGKDTFAELLKQADMMAQKALKAKKAANSTANLPLGTPIAVASASCSLELKDPPLRDWSKNTGGAPEIANISFPFYIGNNLSRQDGLIGFYIDNAASNGPSKKLGLPFAQYVSKPEAQVSVNEPLKLSVAGNMFSAAPATELTLLMHPYMDITLSSGILPDAIYKLPAFNIAKVMENINFNFLVNPILVAGGKMNVPVADVSGKKWVWMEKQNKDETSEIKWQNSVLNNKKSGKLNYEPLTAKEGWLQIDKKD